MNTKNKNSISSNRYSNLITYSDGENYYNNTNENSGVNDNIVVTRHDITKNLATIELPQVKSGINTQDTNVQPCLIVSNKNKKHQNTNNICVGNGRTNYASIESVDQIALLVQNSNNGRVQANNNDMTISLSLDKFASAFENETLNNLSLMNSVSVADDVPTTVNDDKIISVATNNVIKSEIVDNVQKNTENVVKAFISTDVKEPQLSDVSKTVATSVASSVENKLSNTTTPLQTVDIDNLKSIVNDCIYNNLSKVYTNSDDAKNASVTITHLALDNVDPQKYKLMVEIATKHPDSVNSITTVASAVTDVVKSSTVVESNDKVVVTNVNPSAVAEAVQSSIAKNDKFNYMINTIKECAEPTYDVIKFPNYVHVIAHCEDNNKITNQLIDKVTKEVTNTTISNLAPNEHFTQYNNIRNTDYSNNIVAYDTKNNRVSINKIIRSAIEHMIGDKTVTEPPTTITINGATVTKDDDKKTVTVVPTGNCNCSDDGIKKLCASIAQNTGAKQIDVTSQTNPSENAMVITIKEPVASTETTVKSVLDAVNTVITDVKKPAIIVSPSLDISKSKPESSCNLSWIIVLAALAYFLFLQKKR